jgi:GGDEF domain-containing protein
LATSLTPSLHVNVLSDEIMVAVVDILLTVLDNRVGAARIASDIFIIVML